MNVTTPNGNPITISIDTQGSERVAPFGYPESTLVTNTDGSPPESPPTSMWGMDVLRIGQGQPFTVEMTGNRIPDGAKLIQFAYMKINPMPQTYQWIIAQPADTVFTVKGNWSETLTVTPSAAVADDDVYLYSVCYQGDYVGPPCYRPANWTTVTNLVHVSNNHKFSDPRIGVMCKVLGKDPSLESDPGVVSPVRIPADVVVTEGSPTDLIFETMLRTTPSYKPGITGFRYRRTEPDPGEMLGEWVTPTDDELRFMGTPPSRTTSASPTLEVKDMAQDGGVTYLYVVEWQLRDGTYQVCDPKIRNQPAGTQPRTLGPLLNASEDLQGDGMWEKRRRPLGSLKKPG